MRHLSLEEIRLLEFGLKVRGKSIKADQVFVDDEDMVRTLSAIYNHPKFSYFNGQAWAEMCHKAIQSGTELTDKQLTQARRQSASVIEWLYYVADTMFDDVNQARLDAFYRTVDKGGK